MNQMKDLVDARELDKAQEAYASLKRQHDELTEEFKGMETERNQYRSELVDAAHYLSIGQKETVEKTGVADAIHSRLIKPPETKKVSVNFSHEPTPGTWFVEQDDEVNRRTDIWCKPSKYMPPAEYMKHLDSCIEHWRNLSKVEDKDVCSHYIDAYQSARSSFCGRLKPPEEPSPQKPEHKLIQKALNWVFLHRNVTRGRAAEELQQAAEEYESARERGETEPLLQKVSLRKDVERNKKLFEEKQEKSCETCGKPKDKPDDELAPCGLPCTGFDLWEAKKPDIPLTSAVVFRGHTCGRCLRWDESGPESYCSVHRRVVYANHGVCDSYEPNDMVIKGWLEHSEESTARNPNADKPIQWRESATDFVTDMKEVIPEHKLWAVEDELKRVAPRPSDFVNELELFREAVDRVRIVALGAANLLKDRKDPYDQGRQATWVQIEQNLKAVLAGHRPHVPKCGACSIEADIGTEEVPHPVDARLHACMDFEKQADTPSMTSECQECGRLYAHSLNGRLPNCPDCNAYHWRRPPLGIRQNHVPEKKESTFIEGSVAEAHRDSQMTRNVHRKNCLDGEHEPDEGFGFFQQRVWVDLEQKESFMRTVRRCKHCGCLYVEES